MEPKGKDEITNEQVAIFHMGAELAEIKEELVICKGKLKSQKTKTKKAQQEATKWRNLHEESKTKTVLKRKRTEEDQHRDCNQEEKDKLTQQKIEMESVLSQILILTIQLEAQKKEELATCKAELSAQKAETEKAQQEATGWRDLYEELKTKDALEQKKIGEHEHWDFLRKENDRLTLENEVQKIKLKSYIMQVWTLTKQVEALKKKCDDLRITATNYMFGRV